MQRAKLNIIARTSIGILCSLLLFTIWYSVAANYDYGALAGTYVFNGNEETCRLYLRSDQTFVQVLSHSSKTQQSQGHWHRYGESGVSFSSEFLKLSGEEMNGDGQVHGEFEKLVGIFPRLVLAPIPKGPLFRRKLFR